MKKNKIILVGGGGHCKSCIDVIEMQGKYEIAGIVDVKDKVGQKVMGYPVIGSDDELSSLLKDCKDFLITIGQIKSPELRIKKFNELKKMGASFPVIISPLSHVSKTAKIDEGTIVMHGTIVNAEAKIGKNCIINTTSMIEHEAVVGDNTHIATGSLVNGQCEVGDRVFLGSGAVLANNVKIGSDIIIGAGSVVVTSISEGGTYAGNPAKRIK
ncbi:MAG: acetyltransferase [bacterium]